MAHNAHERDAQQRDAHDHGGAMPSEAAGGPHGFARVDGPDVDGPESSGPEFGGPDVDPAVLERLMQRALAETLHPSVHGGPRSEVVLAASARLEKLLHSFGHFEGLRQRLAAQRETLTAELSRLRSAVVARRGFLEVGTEAAVWPVDAERWRTLRWRIQARLLALVDGAPASGGAARVAANEILEMFSRERAASLADLRRRSDAEIVQLERRLQALAKTVEEAEQLLEVLRETPLDEGGVRSYFRESEGLDPQAPQHETKRALLDGLFRKNLELRREE